MRSLPVMVVAALAIGAWSAVAAFEHGRPQAEAWREIAWPFPRDGWPAGRAFRCATELCGDEIEVYVRPKAGFCNCDSGVRDDEEVDRVADLDLMSERFAPLAPGGVIRIAGMQGRLRSYDLQMADGSRHAAVGIAVSRRCDLLVAAAQGKTSAPEVQRIALEFLATDAVTKWMASSLDGR
jgi:hypothetical protein